MKLASLLYIVPIAILAQTNTFPSTGNVGIGSTNPDSKLKVIGTTTIGGKWNPTNSIFRISDRANDMIMDTNELYGLSTLYVGVKNGDIMRLRTVTDSGNTDRVIFKANGDVGIGTNSPSGKLHVTSATSGDAIFKLEADTDNNNEADNPEINFSQDGGLVNYFIGIEGVQNTKTTGTQHNALIVGTEEVRDIQFINGDQVQMTVKTSGVGIGTTNPGSYKLAVKGKIRAEEIKVETGWADYVFKEDYDLPTLEEVEKHIQEKGHLINIPSAKQVEENGIQLGQMNKLLLEKIEELTLYILELKKENENQQKEIEQLKKQNHERP